MNSERPDTMEACSIFSVSIESLKLLNGNHCAQTFSKNDCAKWRRTATKS